MDNLLAMFHSVEWSAFGNFAANALKGFGVLIVGWMVAGWANRTILKRLGNAKGLQANATLRPLIATFTKYTIILITLYAALKTAGIEVASLLAVLGAAGLAIALAVQGTLANVAAGIMLIFLRSVNVGDSIQTPDLAGSVEEIGLFTTLIRASNGAFISVPNAQIWAKHVVNYSRANERRIDINIALSRDNDLGSALKTIEKTLLKDTHIIRPQDASVALTLLDTNTANIQARCWVNASEIRTNTSALNLVLHNAVRKGGYSLPPIKNI